jgi:hypothetical protein
MPRLNRIWRRHWRAAPHGVAAGRADALAFEGTVVAAGVDGTCSGQAALAVAARIARGRGLGLLGVHVVCDLDFLTAMAPVAAGYAAQWCVDRELEAFLDTAAAAAAAGVDYAFAADRGEVSRALLASARRAGAGLVVVGIDASHRRWHRCPARRLAASGEMPVVLAGSVAELPSQRKPG